MKISPSVGKKKINYRFLHREIAKKENYMAERAKNEEGGFKKKVK